MNGNIFQTVPLVKASFLQRLFKQFPTENAVIELNNLLASKPVRDISIPEVATIENRYQLSLIKEFKLNLEEFYAVYFNRCVANNTLNKREQEDLDHLKNILRLDDTSADKLQVMIGEPVFRKAYQHAISGGRLTNDQQYSLNQLSQALRLPQKITEQVSAETRMNFIKQYVERVIANEQYAPAEEQELQAISRSFNVNIQLNEKTKGQLQKLKLYWALEHLDLPVIQPDIAIQRSEVCHMRIPHVNWYELRSERQRTSYSGYTTSIRIAKGFYLRSGSTVRSSYSIDVMKLIDTGTLYLTNKRIIFTGSKKNNNIQLGKIIELTPYADGVKIGKETGKSPTLQISHNADIFCMMLERILNER